MTIAVAVRRCFDYDRTMKVGPNIASIASLIGDPARANMLTALIGGHALTASELAEVAGVTVQTASSHLSRLLDGDLISVQKQGRHRYFQLADGDVAHLLESLMGVAARAGRIPVRTGPKEPALRQARVCYDHLAGDLGVQLLESLKQRHMIEINDDDLTLTPLGEVFFRDFGLDLESLLKGRRRLCRACLDWSVRRHHLAGSLGATILTEIYRQKWASRDKDTRIVRFSKGGLAAFEAAFPVENAGI